MIPEKLQILFTYPCVLVLEKSYLCVSTFIAGMDYSQDGPLSLGFTTFLKEKYRFSTGKSWTSLIPDLLDEINVDIEGDQEERKLNFLRIELEEFYSKIS